MCYGDGVTEQKLETRLNLQLMARNAAAFCVQNKHITIDGRAVMQMASYLQTCEISIEERIAVLGIAVDIYINAINGAKF